MENMKQGKYSNGVFFKLFSLSHSILFLRSYRVIRVLPPPSLADHLCGMHMGLRSTYGLLSKVLCAHSNNVAT